MFVWSEGPAGLDTVELYDRAVAENVAYVPGQFFYPLGGGSSTMRLNFTMLDEQTIAAAVKTLGAVLTDAVERL
jgi:2-aminoadipate transaminase